MKRLLLLALSLTACGHSMTFTPLNAAPRAVGPRNPGSVEIFMSGAPQRSYVEVGLIEIEQQSSMSDGSDIMIQKMRERAAEEGCDGLVIGETTNRVQSYSDHGSGTTSGSGTGVRSYSTTHHSSVNYVKGHRATCIVYRDAEAAGTTALTSSTAVR